MTGRTASGKGMGSGAPGRGNAPGETKLPKARGSLKARRSAARLAAVQVLYQVELTGTPADRVLAEFIDHRIGHEVDGDVYVPADKPLLTNIVRGTAVRQAEIDGVLSGALDARAPLERMELLLKAMLRAGCYELLAHGDIPPGIIVCGYVDVAHAFFSGKETALVNGVLDRLRLTLRGNAAPDGAPCAPAGAPAPEDP